MAKHHFALHGHNNAAHEPLRSLAVLNDDEVTVGLPLAGLGFAIAVLMEAGGGALLLLGYRTRLVAPLMALFTLATAIFFHHNFADQNQMIHFLKNIMLAGGLLNIAYFGAGPVSLDSASGRQALASAGQQA